MGDLRAGDQICFYATPLVGVVAKAEAASVAEHSEIAGDPFPMRFGVRHYEPIDPPVAIDLELCERLDFFRDKDVSPQTRSSLVQVTRSISAHDFGLLTGEVPESVALPRLARADAPGTRPASPTALRESAGPATAAGKVLGRRMYPATAFKYLERALQEGLGRREFGSSDMKQVREFFGEPLSCVYCGSSDWERWDHLVPAIAGGEAVLGNIVPACQPCDDSKGSRPFDAWLATRSVPDRDSRIKRIREYQLQFGYVSGRAESRLTPHRLAQFEDLVRRAKELQRDIEAFLRSPKA